jgi:hypothetical protein
MRHLIMQMVEITKEDLWPDPLEYNAFFMNPLKYKSYSLGFYVEITIK